MKKENHRTLYSYDEAFLKIQQMKFPNFYAKHILKNNMMIWDHKKQEVFITFEVDAELRNEPVEHWMIIDSGQYLDRLFPQFQNDAGETELVYFNLRGEERVYEYGTEKELPFNWLMQNRWLLRNKQS